MKNPPGFCVSLCQACRALGGSVTPGEFRAQSGSRNVLPGERVVPPRETITVHMPSLAPGNYQFFDDFHHEVPNGLIVSQ